jgi:hypothetical protein
MTTDEAAGEFVKHLLSHPYWLIKIETTQGDNEAGVPVLNVYATYKMEIPWDDVMLANGYMLEKLIDTYGKPGRKDDSNE